MKTKKTCCPDNVVTLEMVGDFLTKSALALMALGVLYGIGCSIHSQGTKTGIEMALKCQNDGKYYSRLFEECR